MEILFGDEREGSFSQAVSDSHHSSAVFYKNSNFVINNIQLFPFTQKSIFFKIYK